MNRVCQLSKNVQKMNANKFIIESVKSYKFNEKFINQIDDK